LGDLDARGAGLDRLELAAVLRAGLEVPQVHVAGAAAHPQDDEALVLLLQLRLGGPEAVEEVQARNGRGGGARHVREEVPAVHHGLVSPPGASIVRAPRSPRGKGGATPSQIRLERAGRQGYSRWVPAWLMSSTRARRAEFRNR